MTQGPFNCVLNPKQSVRSWPYLRPTSLNSPQIILLGKTCCEAEDQKLRMESGLLPPEGVTVDLRVDMMSIGGINNYLSWGHWYLLSRCISLTASWVSALYTFWPRGFLICLKSVHESIVCFCSTSNILGKYLYAAQLKVFNDEFKCPATQTISSSLWMGEIVQTNNETCQWLQNNSVCLIRTTIRHSVCVLLPKICSFRSGFRQWVICSVPVFKKEAIILISFKSVSNGSDIHHSAAGFYTHTHSPWPLKSCYVMIFLTCFSSSSLTSIDAVFY